jgi:hypothetical protein
MAPLWRGRSEPWVGRGGGSSEVGVESVFRGRGRVRAPGRVRRSSSSFGAEPVTPQVSISRYVGRFILISNAQWRFLFLDHIYLLLSSYLWRFHRFLNLFDLKNSQIWSLLKLLFLEANANSKVSLVSHLPSRLIYSDSGQLWCYLIYVWIRFLDSRSTSKYLIQIRILPQDLFVSTSN